MEFAWDEAKAASNLQKHDVSFSEAGTVFNDPYAITYDDPDHSSQEDRFITLGYSQENRLLDSFTHRASRNDAPYQRPARRTTREELI